MRRISKMEQPCRPHSRLLLTGIKQCTHNKQQEIEEEVIFLANPFEMFVITTDYVTFILHIGQ